VYSESRRPYSAALDFLRAHRLENDEGLTLLTAMQPRRRGDVEGDVWYEGHLEVKSEEWGSNYDEFFSIEHFHASSDEGAIRIGIQRAHGNSSFHGSWTLARLYELHYPRIDFAEVGEVDVGAIEAFHLGMSVYRNVVYFPGLESGFSFVADYTGRSGLNHQFPFAHCPHKIITDSAPPAFLKALHILENGNAGKLPDDWELSQLTEFYLRRQVTVPEQAKEPQLT